MRAMETRPRLLVLISPGGFATAGRAARGRWSSGPHQPWRVRNPRAWEARGARGSGPHQPWRVRNPVSGSPNPTPGQRVLISPGGFATTWAGLGAASRRWSSSALEGSQRRSWIAQDPARAVLISPGGFATGWGRSSRRRSSRSSSALEGSQHLHGAGRQGVEQRPHQPWRVRNSLHRPGVAPRRNVLISPGGFATLGRRDARRGYSRPHQPWRVRNRIPSWSTGPPSRVLISPGGFAT